ncbi:transcriptional regulator [Duganella sp. FT80W]|uniref:Transcriptional regulator n=1 Tax=Duganella guangzhouensis TaxID=2666084 RepID=A0A6I2KUZ1_9BURK|nr:helix-turn-helix domain-containing protein [Duganella guangzhouensis]MRW88927.1 transcriptional regulator [Duganella guangzhouensis]
MAQRKTMQHDPCPVARALDLVGDRWSMLIIRDALDGIRRFGDFQRNLGVARNILADRLAALVEHGLLATQAASDGSAYHEYVLTSKGESLFTAIVALRQWGERHLFAPGEAHSVLVETGSGKRVAAMHPHDHEGKVLKPAHAVVKKVTLK